MNIFGEGFPDEIVKQVDIREKIYGSGYVGANRTSEQISYLNAKTGWCKLVSGVDIKDAALINNPIFRSIDRKGSDLAKSFILFNGISTQINPLLNSYGIGGSLDIYGSRPTMGIQSARITHENRGSLRRAEVKIKAFSTAQFEIIDILYLRLGFSILLEWGHSMYIKNNDVFEINPQDSLASEFLEGGFSYEEFLRKIHKKRLTSEGNYDAMFAKVSNFHYTFNPDGSYDITLNLISAGDIIESLKINSLLSPTIDINDSSTVDSWAKESTIGTFLYFLKENCKTKASLNVNPNVGIGRGQGSAAANAGASLAGMNYTAKIRNLVINDNIKTDSNFTNLLKFPINVSLFEPNHIDCLSAYYLQGDYTVDLYYVRLGTFLQFIQNYIIPRIIVNNTNIPSLFIDYDTPTNIMNLDSLQVGIDPDICLVNRSIEPNPGETINFGFEATDLFINQDLSTLDFQYGNIMNIYVNFNVIINTIKNLKNDQGNVFLFDFLKEILNKINEGLGGINDLDIFIDETENKIKIIDKNPLNKLENVVDKLKLNASLARFSLINYKTETDPESTNNYGKASFIKNYTFTTEIPPQFATMITVGATANGGVVGADDTALSRLNKGLKDRFKEEVSNSPYVTSKNNNTGYSTQEDYDNKFEKYNKLKEEYVLFLKKLSDISSGVTREDVETYKNTLNSLKDLKTELDKIKLYLDFEKGTITDPYMTSTTTGFIPFNLSLTMEGLSGAKINQQFLIDIDYLPSNYPDTVKFLIKNMSHEISNNKWLTTMESYCIAKPEQIPPAESVPTKVSNSQTLTSQTQQSTLPLSNIPGDSQTMDLSNSFLQK